MGNCVASRMKRLFTALVFLLALSAQPVFAQSCNPSSGWLIQNAPINIGDLLQYGPACGQVQSAGSFNITNPTFQTVTLTAGPLTINATPNSLNLGFNITQSLHGAWSPGPGAANLITVTSDDSSTNNASNPVCALCIFHTFGGSNAQGSRSALYVKLTYTGSPHIGDFDTDSVVITAFANSSSPQGAQARSLYAANPACRLDSGATGYAACLGAEVEVGINTGASANYLIGWNVVNIGTAQASIRSVAYSVSGANGTPGFQYGLLFTNRNGSSPFTATASLFSADYSQTVGYGIEWSQLTFASKVFNFANSSLDNAGNWASNGGYTSNGGAGFINNDGGGGTAVLSANSVFASHAANIGNTGNFPLVFITNNLQRGSISNGGIWNIGLTGTLTGQMGFSGATSGMTTLAAQAVAGSATSLLPTLGGTLAGSATSPIAVNATTGNITCATCATTTNGGALSGAAPVAISAAGSISITGVANEVLAGAGPAFTATPTLGTAGSLNGSLTINGNSLTSILVVSGNVSNTSIGTYYNGPSFFYQTVDSSFTNNNTLGVDFRGGHGNSYAAIVAQITDQTNGAVKGKLALGVANGSGAASNFIYIEPTGGLNVGTDSDPGAGIINATSGYKVNGAAGITQTCTVNQAKTLIFTLGILTGGSCNS